MKVSIVILAFQNNFNLQRAIQSVVSQSYLYIECIIVINHYDESLKIFVEAGVKIIEQPNSSEQELFLLALAKATGEYIFTLKADSYLSNKHIFSELLTTGFDGSHDIVCGDINRLFPDGSSDIIVAPDNFSANDIFYERVNIFYSSLIKKSLLQTNWPSNTDLKLTNEWVFIFKVLVLSNAKYKHINSVWICACVSRAGEVHKLSDGHLRALEKQKVIKDTLPQAVVKLIVHNYYYEELVNTSRFVKFAMKLESINSLLSKNILYYKNKLKYYINSCKTKMELNIFLKKRQKFIFDIPIIINNRNHLSYLLRLIKSLESRGYKNIFIIDNNSSYQPLLDYYSNSPYKVYKLGENVGFCALWDTNVFEDFKDTFYAYTDSDIEIVEECPPDFLGVLLYYLNKYNAGKIGLSLLINNLPDYFRAKNEVINWETNFHKIKAEKLLYIAPVDTTFALYKPNVFGYAGMISSFRTRYPYSASHLPWYENSENLTPEQLYYYRNAKTSTHWSVKANAKSEMPG